MFISLRSRVFVLGVALCAVMAMACGSPKSPSAASPTDDTRPLPERFGTPVSVRAHQEFLTAVARPIQRNFRVYWLGRQFTAGAVVLDGPEFATANAANDTEEFQTIYVSHQSTSGRGLLELYLFSRAGWPAARQNLLGSIPETAGKTVDVANRPARLFEIMNGKYLNRLVAVIEFDDGLVVATANRDAAHPDATPNANPLIDEQTFLSVLEKLRPYPEP